ncbi:MAG TPA: bifunctional (p)ppGpp synthetase/guanosine-3',5'-bis(diphosphate) 3'-pyrophosphohydrolase [candidate division Zixibacteria bacterium]|nr:bifunctional (p)ppGpp synthetase/guanosine-3',5'-bis(diphosphate) 3'-pyrophosphohydrolase [candidate division Zixibacteria bacterium]
MASLRQQIATNVLTVTKFRDLLKLARANRPADDIELIRRAYDYSLEHHDGQQRASGEPYLVHPLEVALILAEMKLDTTAIAAGLLHDSVEDTSVTIEQIKEKFGEQVAHIVEGVTKISKIDFASREEAQAENVRKMMLAMVDDIRVVLIKLADRLHNMRTLEHLSPERQTKIAKETLEIYAPLAHRLGMGKIRGELEDLAFPYVDPVGFKAVTDQVNRYRKDGERLLKQMEEVIHEKLRENHIDGCRVTSRIKRFYSIYQKIQRQKISVDQMYDLMALRVITKSVNDCYAVLGIIHNAWRPVPGRIKDFIAMPRPNLYQSLHTTIIAENGHPFEVQIRTEEMHRMAEEGIAAHWKYKDGPISARDEQRLSWLRQVVEWQREMADPGEFLSTLKIDLYPEEVYTFTPKGKVVILPRDATPIDFAYTIHSQVGDTCVGAKVNGRIVPLRYKLRSGDIVEILTQTGHTPSRDWLSIVKSSRARQKIKHWLNVHQRERAIEIGRKLIEKEARKYRISLKDIKDNELQKVAAEYGLGKVDDLMASLGYGKYSAKTVLGKVVPAGTPEGGEEKPGMISSVVKRVFGNDKAPTIQVRGHDDLLVYRARCCNPIRGEEIVGYVTRGKGVAVHSRTCTNVENLMYEPERRIAVEWTAKEPRIAGGAAHSYPVKLTVFADDRAGMLKNITAVIGDDNTNISTISSQSTDGMATIDLVIDISDMNHLNRIVNGLRKLPGVRDVERIQKLAN